ncbi:MAG: S53 family peptidase, partial [Acidimicrobiales bacterium]
LGGGVRRGDLQAYFSSLGLPEPAVEAVSVDGAKSSPGSAGGPDAEVMLDIEVVGAVAPGATIAVYFAPNTEQGFLDAVTAAVHDSVRRPSVVSISWGSAESTWSGQAMAAMEDAFQAAAAMGVTVTVASGDGGSSDGVADGLAHVDFPASAPHALGCGGTRLAMSGGRISSETVWNDGPGQGATGGGVSDVFALPAYQANASVPPSANPGGHVGRGVPDVAGDADPDTGYLVRVDGVTTTIGGTSAVAPLWAALVALLNEELTSALGSGSGSGPGSGAGGRRAAGFLQPLLYTTAGRSALRDVVSGSNGVYSAHPGWDACTGLGSPDGTALLGLLRGV